MFKELKAITKRHLIHTLIFPNLVCAFVFLCTVYNFTKDFLLKGLLKCQVPWFQAIYCFTFPFQGRSESVTSVYSAAGGGRYGTVTVTGEVLFGLNYNHKASILEINIKECRNLAAVDTKRNRSDP